MLISNQMEGETITTNNLITSIKRLNVDGKEHGTIKALLKNFILPETDMAIKHNQSDKYVYTVPVKPPVSERTKSINEAKQAFLNSTVNSTAPPLRPLRKAPREPSLHYAQIAITTDEDTRSTGGGKEEKIVSQPVTLLKSKIHKPPVELPNIKKKLEHQPQARKVSFKIKNASASYRRPPVAAKQVTITSTKVSELTKKFNDLMIDSPKSTGKQSKLVKTIEDLQSASKNASNSSTPSSTLSSSPNIKIVLRHKRGSKKRNHRQRCSSMDSIDKLIISDNASAKIRVIRSQSDGTKIPKSPKKLLKYQDSSEQQSGSDSIDGPPAKSKSSESPKQKYPSERNVVKNVIEKFECEINAQSNHNNTLKRQTSSKEKKSTIPVKEKPKVPEKKSTLVLTKNIVLKDGVPKIRTIKPLPTESPKKEDVRKEPKIEVVKRKEPIYDRKRYKTNYIHADKLPMHVVDIIHEDNERMVTITNTNDEDRAACLDISISKEEKTYQELTSPITPNESFLWRRKSYTPIYSDSEKSVSDSPYGFISVTMNETTITCSDDTPEISIKEESQLMETVSESQVVVQQIEGKRDSNSDFESNLVEAYNKEILVGYTSKPKQQEVVEDDYEPLEPRNVENVLVIPIKSIDRSSKINCPLPEIPKQKTPPESPGSNGKGNIYQCLLEMRSHPEGDESSLHNYELCDEQLEERTRGDGDSDDGYEYCKSPIKPYCHTSSTGIQIAEHYQPFPTTGNSKNYAISKSVSGASTASYEKIGSDRIYEKIPTRPPKSKDSSPNSNRHSMVSDYNGYNENENIYDTIKHADAVSLSHCYESIPNSPSMVKMRTNLRKQVTSAAQKRLSFDTVSNVSLSTISSEQKTNSIYGQRSVISFNGQEIAFQVPSSEVSVSGSDRSDDWVDVSDEEKSDEQKIIIVRERSRGRKSPISWSQKVRHQWQHTPKQRPDDKVFVTSPTKVYLDTSTKCQYYSQNDDEARRVKETTDRRARKFLEDRVRLIDVVPHKFWLDVRTVSKDGEYEVQDLVMFVDCDSSDSGHVYESLEPAPQPPAHPHPLPLEDDFDSFDSDTDYEEHDKSASSQPAPELPASRLPLPPSSGQYTLTKIASAAQKKMRQIKRNLTKRYSVAMDGKPNLLNKLTSNNSNGQYDVPKTKKSPIYANCEKTYEKPEIQHIYSNITFNDTRPVLKTEQKIYGSFKDELNNVIGEKRLSNGEIPPPLPEKPPSEKPTTPIENKKDNGTLSRKAYLSFKSRFRRATSLAVDINTDVPSALKITNSTFYLTDSMDGDSGFSNCSDLAPGSTEALPQAPRRRDGKLRSGMAESSPCLALERPAVPPPPPPAPATDLSAVNEELKRLLPTLSRKEKAPRARTSWYAECGSGSDSVSTTTHTSNTSWYAEAGLYQAGNISSSSGASSGSHPASPLPHSLFPHEPLYQFYTAAKVESVCRETGDSDSDAYEATGAPGIIAPPAGSTPPPITLTPPGGSTGATTPVGAVSRPSAMALVAPRGPARTLWCEVPEVVNSTMLSKCSDPPAGSTPPPITLTPPGGSTGATTPVGAVSRPSAMALVAPRGPARTLWCEVPEVVNSTVLSKCSDPPAGLTSPAITLTPAPGSTGATTPVGAVSRPSAMALVAPRGPARTLWCEVPEVVNSTVLSKCSDPPAGSTPPPITLTPAPGSTGATTPVGAVSRPSAMALVAPRGPARTLWCEVPEVVNSTVLSKCSDPPAGLTSPAITLTPAPGSTGATTPVGAVSRPSAMALVAPRGPARTLWCEVPEVVNSTVLSSLAPSQKRLQEAKFELLTSEASYLNSLNVLEAHFISHPAFRETHILPRADWESLFSTILPVRKCSQLLMNELEKCWQDNILLTGICEIVQRHAEKHFHVYVKYCENQALMVKSLQRLRERPTFATALRRLENHPACQSLSLHSFLMLPMQRVTRLPLLLDAVLKNLSSEDQEYETCMHALHTLNNFVQQCNEGARNTERIEEMFRLSQSIEFPPNIKDAPSLGPACGRRDRRPIRWLVRSGEMTQLIWKTDELKLTFGKKFHKVPLHLFLFNDLLVITKRKSEDSYIAVDHCPRSLLEVCSSDSGAAQAKHALLLTLLENHEGRTVEMLMSCPSETDVSRWIEALVPPTCADGEAVYAGWDCPQVAALYAYSPAQPDELQLTEGDIVNVTRKTSEGWYYGERTRDGEAGWFPGAYTAEIASAHVRARNLRQRYRLLALSGTYLGQKKRPV